MPAPVVIPIHTLRMGSSTITIVLFVTKVVRNITTLKRFKKKQTGDGVPSIQTGIEVGSKT